MNEFIFQAVMKSTV